MDGNVADFADDIRSGGSSAQERLKNLKEFLSRNQHEILRSWGKNNRITRDSFHALLESLFSCARVEKASYLKANKPASKTKIATKLSLCAEGLRNTVQTAGHKFSPNVVKAVVKHVLDTLPTAGEGYCVPLHKDYLRTLTILLSIPYHVEHLTEENWGELVEFCLEGISLEDEDSQTNDQNGHRQSPTLTESRSGRSTPSRTGRLVPIRPSRSSSRVGMDEFMLCLEYLTAAPNSPLVSVSEQIFDGMSVALKKVSPTSRSSRSAFTALNSTLLRTLPEKPDLVKHFYLEIIPIIRKFWEKSSKIQLLRDEMLITLVLSRQSLASLIRSENQQYVQDCLANLLDTLQSEYSKLFERDQLQLEELGFALFPADYPLAFPHKQVTLASSKAEHNWTLLQTIADIVALIDRGNELDQRDSLDETDGPPTKRQRVQTRTNEILRFAGSDEAARLPSLQILCFFTNRQRASLEFLRSILDVLTNVLQEESAIIVSWAMLALAGCCGQDDAKRESLKPQWLHIWQLASRNVTNVGKSRYASHLMCRILSESVLSYLDCMETLDSIVSPDGLLSPPIISDATLLLWSKIAVLKRSTNPSISTSILMRIVTWLRLTWVPEALQGRLSASHMAVHVRPVSILFVLLAATGRSLEFPKLLSGPAAGPITRAYIRYLRDNELVDYLLLTHPPQDLKNCGSESGSHSASDVPQITDEGDQLVFDLLQTKIDGFSQAWLSMMSPDSSRVSTDIAKIVCSLCIATNAFLSCAHPKESKRVRTLRLKCDQLWEQVCQPLSKYEDKLSEFLDVFGSCLPAKMDRSQRSDFLVDGIARMAAPYIICLDKRNTFDKDASPVDDFDMMDAEDSPASTRGQPSQEVSASSFIRYSLPTAPDVRTYRSLVLGRLHVLAEAFQVDFGTSSEETTALDYITHLSIPELVGCEVAILESVFSRTHFERQHAATVLERIGVDIIGADEYERCEAALCACIAVLEGLAEMWVCGDDDDLSDSAAQIYSFFIRLASAPTAMSSQVYVNLSNLLQKVLTIDPQYSPQEPTPSPRTTLFLLLRQGDLVVKFEIGKRFSEIFGHFILQEHEAIFDDVVESLPADAEWVEGLFLRIFVLGELAAKWHTLLRRSVYHIFETAGQVPPSAKHARYCLSKLSTSLGLQDSRQLLKLFVSQLLYTWLENQTIRRIPYRIFGYPSLKNFLADVQEDVTGQIMMRSNDDEAQLLSDCLRLPFEDLLKLSFPKVEAYSVAYDISTPKSQDSEWFGGETRVRKRLGNEMFAQLIQNNFPSTLAVFFQTMDQDAQVEKAFAKKSSYQAAHRIFTTIVGISCSDSVLPANQQPSFRAKYILDELEFLCGRANYDPQTLWTPALFVFVARKLLDSIHPALGSLHACSIVRKLRVLICLAGDVVLQDYPIEMMLHALRPLVTDFHSSNDAIGLFQYLLEYGQTYLSSNPSFVASIALSTLTSLKIFLNSSQDSTTQESDFQSTLSKAQVFHSWLGEYLKRYQSTDMSEELQKMFDDMVHSAQMARTTGNAEKGSHESALLQQLLQDKMASQNLLSVPAWDSVFGILSSDFQKPPKFQNDIFGEPDQSVTFAASVWESTRRPDVGIGYLSWAGRVLGRAYSSTGHIRSFRRDEQSASSFGVQSRFICNQSSTSTILLCLSDNLFSNDSHEIGLIEGTLQYISERLNGSSTLEEALPSSLKDALTWDPYFCPEKTLSKASRVRDPFSLVLWDPESPVSSWTQNLAIALSLIHADDPALGALDKILSQSVDLAQRLFPYILHSSLLLDFEPKRRVREVFSALFREGLRDRNLAAIGHVRVLLNAILYIRNQPRPNESTITDRENWLDIDYADAAGAALCCQMYRTALLFTEVHTSRALQSSRRSFIAHQLLSSDILFDIFKHIDDPDSFYGVDQQPSLQSVVTQLEYEGIGLKSTSFQSARFDSGIRRAGPNASNALGLVQSLNSANLKGLARTLLSDAAIREDTDDNLQNAFQTALALRQWDLPTPKTVNTDSANIFRAFQSLNLGQSEASIRDTIDRSICGVMKNLIDGPNTNASLNSALGTLTSLTDIDELLSCDTFPEVEERWSLMLPRSTWMHTANFSDVNRVLSGREVLFASLTTQPLMKTMVKATTAQAQLQEIRALHLSLKLSRKHSALQTSLNTVTYLSDLGIRAKELGLHIDALGQFEVAKVLWDHGEMDTSIKMLRSLERRNDLHKQALPISRSELLVSLGHEISEARLEKPDEIINRYLLPAIKDLNARTDADEAGLVFHEFASFCDRQLQNPENRDDYLRLEKLRRDKKKELEVYDSMLKSTPTEQRKNIELHRNRTKTWFEIDDREYQRVRSSRETFLRQSLENYLLCLKTCESFNNDVLRFCALWLDMSANVTANEAVERHISQVASRKFVPLMNQLSSRLLDEEDAFQQILYPLLLRICVEHPFHGMYQMFFGSKSRVSQDPAASARFNATKQLVDDLKRGKSRDTWVAIHNAAVTYTKFAAEKLDGKFRSGTKGRLIHTENGQRLLKEARERKIPPSTMRFPARVDCDYSKVPRLANYKQEFTVAGGISAPKIVTALASDGLQYKQLFKGGNDDLRQDAIMEQVFEQVSNLLQDHRETRQRNLGIRTYRVLPLTANTGIIEFVQDTVPLHDYLLPAHQRHYPKDLKPSVCRKQIQDAQPHSIETRVRIFRSVTDKFRPVLRFFFMERFTNPDEWFEKRLAYARTTAAISILGWVLGLGDRHGHNILLDERTGEVVHIDLGIAFEQGRVLPVPEVVPFRLTHDSVDGMGITKTEGVFRRCCEFTLEALREESYSIMTILDVLRYDPLYSWTISPLRMKKIQDSAADGGPTNPRGRHENEKKTLKKEDSKTPNEQSEADRALTVVAKKLGKSLSVTATVNELIQQATDERNLAVLFCGWAAYA